MSELETKPRPDSGAEPGRPVDYHKLRHDMRGCIGVILTYMHILENAQPGKDLSTISKPCTEAARDLEELVKVFEQTDTAAPRR